MAYRVTMGLRKEHLKRVEDQVLGFSSTAELSDELKGHTLILHRDTPAEVDDVLSDLETLLNVDHILSAVRWINVQKV